MSVYWMARAALRVAERGLHRGGVPWYAVTAVVAVAWALYRSARRQRLSRRHRWRVRAGEDCLRKVSGFSSAAQMLAYLRKVEPLKFEEALMSAFAASGARVTRNRRYSGDGGIDGRFAFAGRRYCVQAKRYKGYVNPRHVTDFADALRRENGWAGRLFGAGAPRGVFVHTGRMSDRTRALARSAGIEVVEGEALAALFRGRWCPDEEASSGRKKAPR